MNSIASLAHADSLELLASNRPFGLSEEEYEFYHADMEELHEEGFYDSPADDARHGGCLARYAGDDLP